MSRCRSRGKVKSDSLEQPEDVAFYIRLRPHLIPAGRKYTLLNNYFEHLILSCDYGPVVGYDRKNI